MCGIVLAGGNLITTEIEIFNQLLYADVFRGVHATGVFAKRMQEGIVMAKDAVPSYLFQHDDNYKKVLLGGGKTSLAPAFIVGHNRHATRGAASDPKGAHPFQHGNITLVHNGTLTDQSLLPDHEKFAVDSDNICYSINKIGAAATIQKLDGAFTLVWHDATDDTVHIIRNEERPFHLAKCGLDWFGASEEDMLMWILKRNRSTKSRSLEHFECEVGVEYIFDVSGSVKRFVLKDKVKHDLPVFTYASRWGNYGSVWQGNQGNRSSASTTTTTADRSSNVRAEQNALAIKNNISIRIDDRIVFTPMSFMPFSGAGAVNGKMTGWLMDGDHEYVEVDVFNVPRQMYEDAQSDPRFDLTGTVKSFLVVKNQFRVIVNGVSIVRPSTGRQLAKIDAELTELNDDIPFDVDAIEGELDSFKTIAGDTITRRFWYQHDHGVCMGCNHLIDWKDAPKAAYAYNGFWHPHCLRESEKAEEALREQEKDDADIFVCAACGNERRMKELDPTVSSIRSEDVCASCATKILAEKNSSGSLKTQEYQNARYTHTDAEGKTVVGNRLFSRSEFDRMIRERDSDRLLFKDLAKARITKRHDNVYAYFYKVDRSLDEGGSANTGATFHTLHKQLRKPDGTLANITKALWNNIGTCKSCKAPIPWRDVEKCDMTETCHVICKDCKGE